MMGRLCEVALVSLLITTLLSTDSTWAKRSSSSTGKKSSSSSNRGSSSTSTSSHKPSKTTNTQAGNYPRQPGSPNRNPNPYPAGGSYPYPNQNPARANPAGGYPNQNPAGGYPAAGGYPNQNPGRANPGGYPNQNPAGGYPAAGGYPNQYPGRANPGGYPNQYPAGGYPAAGGYPQRYPAAGGGMGGYPNWNPNNQILSPRYGGGGGYGYGGHGMGGSPFSRSVQSMGHYPSSKSQGFAKKAIMAAGVGAVAGMAIGYGLGRFPRPHFNFRNPEEERNYNNYMYRRYGSQSTDENDFGRDYTYNPPPRAESYDSFMDSCVNKTGLLKDQGSSSQVTPAPNGQSGGNQEEDDTVSIEEIGYPALIEQVKARRCVELYMNYSERFLQKQTAEQSVQAVPSTSSPLSYGLMQLFTSLLMLLSSVLLLQ